jgi:hypothetical protein
MSEKDEDKLAALRRDLAALQAKMDEYEKQRTKKVPNNSVVKTKKSRCSIM